MSPNSDDDAREHEASEQKVRQARERGDVPVASDFWLLGSIFSLVVALKVLEAIAAPGPVEALGSLIEMSGSISVSQRFDLETLLLAVATKGGPVWIMIAGALVVTSVVTGSFPQPPRMSWDRLAVNPQRLDPLKGLGRLFSGKSIAAFLRTLAKATLASVAVAAAGRKELDAILGLVSAAPKAVATETVGMAIRLSMTATLVVASFALLDLVVSRWTWRKKLRMTRQEVKDETKQSEGDPLVKMRMKSIAMDRARKRMLTDVASATMVVTNPTHYAIALRYVREEGGAPVVVAKGQEFLALRIRSEAAAHGVPVLEQPALARSMYRSAEVGQAIPVEFYRAVAEIVNFLSLRQANDRGARR